MLHFMWRGMRHPHGHCFFHHHQPMQRGPFGRGDCGGTYMHGHGHHGGDPSEGGPGPGGRWGIRRPLRFLTHELELDEKQVSELARILDELKIDRAQADVDDHRARAEFADAVVGQDFDAAKAAAAGERRVQSAAKLRDAVIRALTAIHGLLRPEQRERFAYLVRTGVLAF